MASYFIYYEVISFILFGRIISINFSSLFWIIFLFLIIFYCLCYYSHPNFFPFAPSLWYPPSLQQHPLSSCPWIMLFGFSISYTILNIPLFCTCQLGFLIPAPFLPLFPFPLPAENPPMISISMILTSSGCFLSLYF